MSGGYLINACVRLTVADGGGTTPLRELEKLTGTAYGQVNVAPIFLFAA